MRKIRATLRIGEGVNGLEPILLLTEKQWITLFEWYRNNQGTTQCSVGWGTRGVVNILVAACRDNASREVDEALTSSPKKIS